MTKPGVGTGGNHHRLCGTAHHVSAHKAQRVALKRVRLLRFAGFGDLFDRQRFAGQRRLSHKQVARLNHAQIGRDHIPRGEFDDIARHQLIDRQLKPAAFAFVIGDAQHRCGIADHRFQRVGGLGGTCLLYKIQQGGNPHHQHDHRGGEQILRGIGNGGQHGQQDIEWIAVAQPQMYPPRLRLLCRQLVFTVDSERLFHFRRIQPFRVAVKRLPKLLLAELGHFQAVFTQRWRNGRIGNALLGWHRVALNQTARQMAAKLCKQLPG